MATTCEDPPRAARSRRSRTRRTPGRATAAQRSPACCSRRDRAIRPRAIFESERPTMSTSARRSRTVAGREGLAQCSASGGTRMQDTNRRATPRRCDRVAMAAVLIGLALPVAALGEENRAAARVEAMANFLARAQRISVVVDCSYDVVQDSGQKIEFGERREMTLRRPDRVRVDVTRRDGSRRGIVFDGTQLTAFDLGEKVYATISKPGTVAAALA